jgi:CheY-like chemotaxis protein
VPLILLVEPTDARNRWYSAALLEAGFRVASVTPESTGIAEVLQQCPAVVAVALDRSGVIPAINLVHRLRTDARTRLIPFIIYGHHLRAGDIKDAARSGALWLNLERRDGDRFLAAVEGLIKASDERSLNAPLGRH